MHCVNASSLLKGATLPKEHGCISLLISAKAIIVALYCKNLNWAYLPQPCIISSSDLRIVFGSASLSRQACAPA